MRTAVLHTDSLSLPLLRSSPPSVLLAATAPLPKSTTMGGESRHQPLHATVSTTMVLSPWFPPPFRPASAFYFGILALCSPGEQASPGRDPWLEPFSDLCPKSSPQDFWLLSSYLSPLIFPSLLGAGWGPPATCSTTVPYLASVMPRQGQEDPCVQHRLTVSASTLASSYPVRPACISSYSVSRFKYLFVCLH